MDGWNTRRWRWFAVVTAAALVTSGCAAGSDAAPNATGSTTPGTVGGVGVLPDSRPVGGPVETSAGDTPAGSSPTVPSTTGRESSSPSGPPADQAPGPEYVVDPGNAPEIRDSRVLLVGDSVLEATTARSPDDLDRYVATLGWRIWVDAKRGRHVDQGLDTLEELAAEPSPWAEAFPSTGTSVAGQDAGTGGESVVPETVVLMLGNNYEGDRPQLEEAITGILDLLHDVKRIVMFTVPLYKPEQADVNEAVRAAAQRDDRILLVDWERLTREWGGALQTDGLHPTETVGAHLLAQLIARVLGPAPGVPAAVELPVLGVFSDEPLPDWTPPKARETVPTVP